MCKETTTNRFHNSNRDIVASYKFVLLFVVFAFHIIVVKLKLDKIPVVVTDKIFKNVNCIVERKTKSFDFAFCKFFL